MRTEKFSFDWSNNCTNERNYEQIKNRISKIIEEKNIMRNYDGYQLLHEILILNEITAIKKYIIKSADSPTLRHNINRLRRAKMLKPQKEYVKGIQKGTSNILSKYGAKEIYHPYSQLGGGYAAMGPSGKEQAIALAKTNSELKPLVKNLPKHQGPLLLKSKKAPEIISTGSKQFGIPVSKKDVRKDLPLFRRHEADEIRSLMKGGKEIPGPMSLWTDKIGTKQLPHSVPIGGHASPKVLQREKDITDYTTKAYRRGKLGSSLQTIRKGTGEYDMISKLGKKGIRKMEKQLPRHYTSIPGTSAKIAPYDMVTGKPITDLNARIKKLQGL